VRLSAPASDLLHSAETDTTEVSYWRHAVLIQYRQVSGGREAFAPTRWWLDMQDWVCRL